MSLFIKIMGIFWLLAEGLIMVFVRRGSRFLETGDTRQRFFFLFCAGTFFGVVVLICGKPLLLAQLPKSTGLFWHFFYDEYLWNLQCTLWAIIEAAIGVYIYHAYHLLKNAIDRESHRPSLALRYGPALFYGLLIAGYLFYHWYLFHLTGPSFVGYRLTDMELTRNILAFYIKICGVFWVLIESVVAVIAIKTVILLRRRPL